VPDADQAELLAAGVSRIYTPKDFQISGIIDDLAQLAIEYRRGAGRRSSTVGTGA
jgi:methylmalonyl-CoA mutase cobalamin-binding subunit